jgi:hypothetical protein
MPAPPLANTFEGGSDGTSITTGNSGGASGDAFSAVGGTVTFETSKAMHGVLSAEVAIPGVADSRTVKWLTLGSFTTDVWVRVYLQFPSQPATSLRFIRFQTNAGSTCGYFFLQGGTGKFAAMNAAGTGTAVGATEVAYNQWVRFEGRVRAATSNGQMEWRYYASADSASIPDTTSSTTMVLGADADEVQYGNTNTSAPTSYTFYMDDVAVSSSAWLGASMTSQVIVPDADTAAGGWTTTPLFSKINDSSDATIITSTAV